MWSEEDFEVVENNKLVSDKYPSSDHKPVSAILKFKNTPATTQQQQSLNTTPTGSSPKAQPLSATSKTEATSGTTAKAGTAKATTTTKTTTKNSGSSPVNIYPVSLQSIKRTQLTQSITESRNPSLKTVSTTSNKQTTKQENKTLERKINLFSKKYSIDIQELTKFINILNKEIIIIDNITNLNKDKFGIKKNIFIWRKKQRGNKTEFKYNNLLDFYIENPSNPNKVYINNIVPWFIKFISVLELIHNNKNEFQILFDIYESRDISNTNIQNILQNFSNEDIKIFDKEYKIFIHLNDLIEQCNLYYINIFNNI